MTVDPHILKGSGSGIASGGHSFTLRHRLFRVAWSLCWALFAAWTPPPLHAWRRVVLVAFGAEIDRTARVYGSARVWYPPNLRMHPMAVLGRRVTCYNVGTIVIEEGAIVSQGAHLCAGTHEVDDPDFQLVARPIVIGQGAWIASEAFVGPGVVAGQRSVLGARAVAFSDLAAGVIYVGNPARPLRTRGP